MSAWIQATGLMFTVLVPVCLMLAVTTSWKVIQQRRTVKCRLRAVSKTSPMARSSSVTSPLFAWKNTARPLAKIRHVVQDCAERIDALFGKRGLRAVLVCVVLAMGTTCFFSDFLPMIARVALVVVVPMIGFTSVYWVARSLQMKEFERNFPQVIGQISRAVAAGISVPQAIAQVPDYQQGLLGHEFALLRDRLEIGISLKEALSLSSKRLPYSGFHFFTVALILNQENGGQLREVLHSLSRTLHDNSAIKMKIKSLTAEPRMTAVILASLPLILIGFMFFKTPTSFAILTSTEAGHKVLMYVLISMGLGLGIINMLTKVRA